jgi:hypothetical protein
MQVILLYKYIREDGGVTVSPIKPDCEYTEMNRIIADEGKILTNGSTETYCTDVESADGWYEIDDTTEYLDEENANV